MLGFSWYILYSMVCVYQFIFVCLTIWAENYIVDFSSFSDCVLEFIKKGKIV
jgi:hypothetical protein